jgi:hypothetical protein
VGKKKNTKGNSRPQMIFPRSLIENSFSMNSSIDFTPPISQGKGVESMDQRNKYSNQQSGQSILPKRVLGANQINDSSDSSTFYGVNPITRAAIYDKDFAKHLARANKSKSNAQSNHKPLGKLRRVSRPLDGGQNLPEINIC